MARRSVGTPRYIPFEEDPMMKYARLTLALVVPLTAASAQAKKRDAPQTPRTVTVALPDQMTWGPAPAVLPVGAKLAVLDGDPTKPGAYTMRLLMPDGYQLSPHFHPAPEYVTVVSGTLMVGMGGKFDESQMKALPAGAFGMIPAGMHHYAKAKGETVLQLHGIGPWQLIYVNKADDPRKKVAAR
jgi:quercetin dioxygenase-like cupin family protein